MNASDIRGLVEVFYEEMWNRWDEDVMRRILDPAVDFEGSIGLHVTGHDGFAGYMRTIRTGFPDFHNRIDDLIAGEDRAAARLTYTGTHTGPILGHAPSGRAVTYSGAAMFTMTGGRISRVWVLGDRLALLRQIGAIGEADA